MSSLEHIPILPSTSLPSSNHLTVDYSHSNLSSSTMSLPSLPQMKRRFYALSTEGKRPRNHSQESNVSCPSQCDGTTKSTTTPVLHSVVNQGKVAVASREPSTEEPPRKRYRVQQWLVNQRQRLERFKQDARRHRDSMFEQEDIEKVEKELERASQDANSIVPGPDGQPIDQRVIEHFFMLYQSSGSDWRDSVRWERHSAQCLRMQCEICETSQYRPVTPPSPVMAPPPSPPRSDATESWETLPRPRQSIFTAPRWRLKLRRAREERHQPKNKGKSPATSQDLVYFADVLDRSEAPSSAYLLDSQTTRVRQPRSDLVIRDALRRTQEKPVICSLIPQELHPCKFPVPAVVDLKPASSKALDLADPSHLTGRPYEACPLEEGRLPFPLCKNCLPPPTPELKPEQTIAAVPEQLLLEDSSQERVPGAIFTMSPLSSANSSTAHLQRTFRPQKTIRLVDSSTEDLIAEGPTSQREDFESTLLAAATAALRNRNRTPVSALPPTPPDSRQNSAAYPSGIDYTSNRAVVPISQLDKPLPPGPADKDWAACTLSDTTASPLPDCPVFVDPREVLRRGSGGGSGNRKLSYQ